MTGLCGLAACSPPQVTPIDPFETTAAQPPEPTGFEAPTERARAELPAVLETSPDLAWDGGPIPDVGDAWVHPLSGPRLLPDSDGHRFGAFREGERPSECGRGHCGVDLGHERGAVVHATARGEVRTVAREVTGRAGLFVSIDHLGGEVRTYYMHLDWIRPELVPGATVEAGEPLGTVGSTGVVSSGPHLHFAMSRRLGDARWFVDPEPMLGAALTHEGPTTLVAATDAVLDAALLDPIAIDESGGIALEVRDAHTRAALDGVRVRGSGPDGASIDRVVTGGYIELAPLAPGRWTLSLTRAGHSPARARFEVPAGRDLITVRNARVELRQGASLAGVVRDHNGDRVAGAVVEIGGVRTTTNAHGEFRLRDAPTGELRIEASRGEARGGEELALDPGDERVTLDLRLDPP